MKTQIILTFSPEDGPITPEAIKDLEAIRLYSNCKIEVKKIGTLGELLEEQEERKEK